ncbi:hypothetical protein [Actinocatenispora sera]|uniref:Uncharacterized protein n=1 Tax=Actinocatenispora sera TaxID=390989 RepID=A0A810L8G6_9ACTN|nr:hypothetical protein [Actinocatenispora sera]BCJ31824.1 hypothetical protein Asera_59320 [Actinocatenispora sera]
MRWRLVALAAALIPTALAVATGPHSGGYVGFTDRPVDPAELDLYLAWQTLVTMGVPAVIVAVAWLCGGVALRPAATVAAALLAVLSVVAVFGAIARGALPAPVPAVPRVVLWLYVPCFAAAFVALLRCRSAARHPR